MKYLYILVSATLLFGHAVAQETKESVSFTHVVNFPGLSKDSLINLTQFFCNREPEAFFFKKLKKSQTSWALKRAAWKDDDYKAYGKTELVDRSTLRSRLVMIYEGNKDGCIKFLTIYTDVLFEFKDDKVRISFAGYRYTHKNLESPPAYKKIGDIGYRTCPNAGEIESFTKCSDCDLIVNDVLSFIKTSAEEFVDHYHTRIMSLGSDTAKKNNDW